MCLCVFHKLMRVILRSSSIEEKLNYSIFSGLLVASQNSADPFLHSFIFYFIIIIFVRQHERQNNFVKLN